MYLKLGKSLRIQRQQYDMTDTLMTGALNLFKQTYILEVNSYEQLFDKSVFRVSDLVRHKPS